MADIQTEKTGEKQAVSSPLMRLIGVLVFLVGVAMIVMVFNFTYQLFDSIDATVLRSSATTVAAAPVPNPAAPRTSGQAEAGPPPKVSVARPSPEPTLLQAGAALVLKLLVLAVMAWAGALVASKGTEMPRTPRGGGPPPRG